MGGGTAFGGAAGEFLPKKGNKNIPFKNQLTFSFRELLTLLRLFFLHLNLKINIKARKEIRKGIFLEIFPSPKSPVRIPGTPAVPLGLALIPIKKISLLPQ